ncbi:MAG: PD40 domain-containing protein [Ignavibacteriae bacterium]|nr:PD40 domain-containing protein [Ignavibacteriota bacterium]
MEKRNNITLKLLSRLIIFFIFLSISMEAKEDIKGGILDRNVNSGDEDYSSYLVFGEVTDTLFFTSSRPVPNRRPIALAAEIFYSTRPAEYRIMGKPINEGWSSAKQIVAEASRIAQFSRGSQAISPDRIIFAAERDLSTSTSSGSSYLFDLWQMTKTSKGYTSPEPITNLNDADAWDSQPALSSDGKILYFVSNRQGGEGGLDIWYSVMDLTGTWSKPKPVPNINTPGNDGSPHCGADGKFYFSSDWNYEKNEKGNTGKDIYRADYQDENGIPMPVNPVNFDEAMKKDAEIYGIEIPENIQFNSENDDEFPFISPDRKFIFITSNRKAEIGRRNLYAFALPKSKIKLLVNVTEQIFDANGNLVVPPTIKIGLPLSLVDSVSGVTQEISSGNKYEIDADRTYLVRFTKFVEEECYQNKIEGPQELKVFSRKPFGFDTLYIRDALISRKKVEIPPIIFHSTDTLPYFITGYWYPITTENMAEYRLREQNGFFDNTGFVDSTGHDYEILSKKIDIIFDEQIYKPLEKLLPSFQEFCRDTLILKITIHGYTDPRGLSSGEEHPYRQKSKFKRNYPDDTVTIGVDERGSPVTIPTGQDMWKQGWPKDPGNADGLWIKLPDEGENGNVLLSKLRSYFTFVTFDKVMQKRSPIYAQMKNNNRVVLDAEGFGVDKAGLKERNLRDDPMSRRIEIYIDILRPEELAYHKRMMGGSLSGINKGAKPEVKNKEEVKTEEMSDETKEAKVENKEIKKEETVKPVETKNEMITSTKEVDKTPAKLMEPVKQQETQSTIQCYMIHYNTYDNEVDAQNALNILKSGGLLETQITSYFDEFGYESFRLRSQCFATADDAVKAMKSQNWVYKELNLKKMPVIVK